MTGGSDKESQKAMVSCQRYDIQKDQWYHVADLNKARRDHSSCALGDFVYVFGGPGSKQVLEWLDAKADLEGESVQWQKVELPETIYQPRLAHLQERWFTLMVPFSENSILIIGGYSKVGPLNDVWLFNTKLHSV